MVILNNIKSRKAVVLFESLSKIQNDILCLENIIESEIFNINIEYTGEYVFSDINLKGLNFKIIDYYLNYKTTQVDYNCAILLKKRYDDIKIWFYDRILEDSAFSKMPKSYLVANKLEDILFGLEMLDTACYVKDIGLIMNYQDLLKLKLSVENDLTLLKIKIGEVNRNNNLRKMIKADSDYIKRNKK